MSETKSTADWSKDWQAMQQQYWNAWTDATRQATPQMPPANTPWHEGLEQWSRMFAGAGKQNETADRMMSSAKNYVALMQSMVAAARVGRQPISDVAAIPPIPPNDPYDGSPV